VRYSVSAETMREVLRQYSDLVLLAAVTISHSTIPEPLRFVSDTVDCPYGGHTYFGCPFELDLAADEESAIGQTKIRVANVDQAITAAVRTCTSAPDVALEVLSIKATGDVNREAGPIDLKLLHVSMDALVVEGTLGFLVDYLNELAVKDTFNQFIDPGIFA
jgi:hypothetical protein